MHPLAVIRETYKTMDASFEEQDGVILARFALADMEVQILAWGEPEDLATVIIRLPLRAAADIRSRTGEFLHRLNFNARRKIWEIDYDDGEIRAAAYTDTFLGTFNEELFRALLQLLVVNVEVVLPYLIEVMGGKMNADFAADQAEAALEAEVRKQNRERKTR